MKQPHDNDNQTGRSKLQAARDLRSDNEAKEAQQKAASQAKRNPLSVSVAMVPPYCYRQLGMTAEEGAVVAVKALRITQTIEALGLLWQLRHVDNTPLHPVALDADTEQAR